MRAGLAAVLMLCLAPLQSGWAIEGWTFHYAVGPEVQYIDYVEPDVMEETGIMAGAFAAVTATGDRSRYRVLASYVAGNLEYPKEWLDEGRAWNEQYLLRALLMHNTAYRIELFTGWLFNTRHEWFR